MRREIPVQYKTEHSGSYHIMAKNLDSSQTDPSLTSYCLCDLVQVT